MKQEEIEKHIKVIEEHLENGVRVCDLDRAIAAAALSELTEELSKAKKPKKQ